MGSSFLPTGTRRGHTTGHGGSGCLGAGSYFTRMSKYFLQLASNAATGTTKYARIIS